jgi:hypothetical protein
MKKTTSDPNRGVSVAVLLVLLALCTSLSLMLPSRALVAWAQGPQENVPCDSRGMVLVHYEKIKLEEKNVPGAPQARGKWFEDSITLLFDIKGDELICLSSKLDGLGPIWVDDAIQMFIKGPGGVEQEWPYNFYKEITKERGEIDTNVPSQDLTRKFGRGTPHIIRTVLWDYHPPYYGNSNLYLIVYRRPTPTPTSTFTPIPTSTPTRTFTPAPTQTFTPLPTPTRTPLPTPPIPATIARLEVPCEPTDGGCQASGLSFQSIFSRIEQGRPFTFTVPIDPNPLIQLQTEYASVTDCEGAVVVERIDLAKQKNTNIYAGQVPGIAQTGAYSLTVSVQGIEPPSNKGISKKTVGFVVGEPIPVRVAKIGGSLGILLLLAIVGSSWAMRTFWWAPTPQLTGGLRILQGEKLVKSERLQRFRSSVVTAGKRGSNIELPEARSQVRLSARYDPPIKRRNQVRHARVIIEVSGASSGNGVVDSTPHIFEIDKYEVEYRKT